MGIIPSVLRGKTPNSGFPDRLMATFLSLPLPRGGIVFGVTSQLEGQVYVIGGWAQVFMCLLWRPRVLAAWCSEGSRARRHTRDDGQGRGIGTDSTRDGVDDDELCKVMALIHVLKMVQRKTAGADEGQSDPFMLPTRCGTFNFRC